MAVASATAAMAETLESMESSPSRRVSDAASESSSSGVLSSNANLSNSSPNYSKDIDIQLLVSPRSEEYRQLFRLPPEEVLIQDYNCALQENFLLQGHMYVFSHYICFYSNLFGFETKKVIPFHEITSLRRAKAAGIFPTAIEILAGEKKVSFFTSFLSRDEAFKLISDGWSQHGDGAKEITDLQDSKLELNIQENGDIVTEKAKSSKQLVDESYSSERRKDIRMSEDYNLPPEAEVEIISSSGVQDYVEEDVAAVVNNDTSCSRKDLTWVEENSDAPEVPDYFTKVEESKFPIRVEEFFNLFFSDAAVDFLQSYHRRCGDKDFKCNSWYPHGQFGHARDASFQHPIKLYLGAKCGSCQEVQKFRIYRNSHLVIETSQEINGVPYGDYFKVEGLWDVQRVDETSCVMNVYLNVAFSKKTMFKGKIVQGTIDEARDSYAIWIETAHELVEQKNLAKEESGSPAADFSMNGQVPEDTEAKMVELLEGSQKASDVKRSQILPDSKYVNQLIGHPLQGTLNGVSSLASLFRESMVKLYLSLKSQSQVPLLLVITFAMILLLMQLCIVVLLSRPQQIQLIPQADYAGTSCSVSERVPEAMMAYLEKRIHHLNDEMLMVETALEKMRQEHTFLKTKLKDLEHFTRQRR
ncbi:protein VASCULAR ASSOCIATED DEATH 1, chloroplastic-like isoform X3 [Actinidia eriantha]|uniref:protein VASCULAR ASSOCIATED DEATH 1, chloroplastic-like isoform X3 n=1 Tax=Actinidia eriantha TaxID=165200 RepID=UPI0025827DED|nr:protein VASCULAR ASSOCIATED DEATH 1, chloroplastic-like isoform X3 [Actinidia eriantha]